ncbi:hypothetical protein HPB51_022289 [Rhipicephalus microplus]|uniref:PiggyBac transposable element-derived protein domain-containing protein n=1 Tax=Rhipicephalus microplus TaxID=6941 RepID=A0A9J6DIV8_RHIMP|nr:hypothetical protein HPB51_022289 [Rhipicephalus microplus]
MSESSNGDPPRRVVAPKEEGCCHALQKALTDDEIQELLFGDESDLDVDSDSGDEAEKFQPESALHSEESDENEDSFSEDENVKNKKFEKTLLEERTCQKAAQSWKVQAFSAPTDIEKATASLACQEPQAPLTYFKEYIEDDLWEFVATRTNLYWVQTNGTTLGMTAKEAKALFGIHIVLGSLKFPQARMYWAAATRVSLIADAMPRDRFFRLRNALHV